MEFRCRVATATGQVMEATYAAESEARLRHELEEKGLFLLSVQGGHSVKIGQVRLRLPRRRKVSNDEFLIFNQLSGWLQLLFNGAGMGVHLSP